VLIGIVVIAGGCVGCGGGGEDEASASVTKAQFVKKADFICADSKRERTAIAEEIFNPKQRQGSHVVGAQSTEELEAELEELAEELLKEKMIPSLKNQQKKLESLGAPAADEAKVEKMLSNLEKAIDEIEQEGFRGLVGGNQFDEFEKEARTYDLHCKVL
jgi:NADH dehydrogenase/NADH:ubiquinone oxidoreductase subunit G